MLVRGLRRNKTIATLGGKNRDVDMDSNKREFQMQRRISTKDQIKKESVKKNSHRIISLNYLFK